MLEARGYSFTFRIHLLEMILLILRNCTFFTGKNHPLLKFDRTSNTKHLTVSNSQPNSQPNSQHHSYKFRRISISDKVSDIDICYEMLFERSDSAYSLLYPSKVCQGTVEPTTAPTDFPTCSKVCSGTYLFIPSRIGTYAGGKGVFFYI